MKTKALIMSAMIAILGVSSSAFAQTHFDATHPRRAEVNGRLGNQSSRIHNKVANGKMSYGEAAKLHREDHGIRNEERRMASRHNGHLTRHEDNRINRQENHVSRGIYKH